MIVRYHFISTQWLNSICPATMNESNDGQSLSSADYNNSDTFLTGSHENNEPSLMERTAATGTNTSAQLWRRSRLSFLNACLSLHFHCWLRIYYTVRTCSVISISTFIHSHSSFHDCCLLIIDTVYYCTNHSSPYLFVAFIFILLLLFFSCSFLYHLIHSF